MDMKKIQERVKEFCKENNLDSQAEHRMLDLVSEIGEVSKELLRMTDYGKKPMEFNDEIETEIGDAFYSLIVLANHFNVDLEEALNIVLEKYGKRLKKGSPGSEND